MAIKIKKPEYLGKYKFLGCTGDYCAVGWLAKELGYDPVSHMRGDRCYDIITDRLSSVTVDDVDDLMFTNDDTPDNERRVQLFEEWCAKHGVELC